MKIKSNTLISEYFKESFDTKCHKKINKQLEEYLNLDYPLEQINNDSFNLFPELGDMIHFSEELTHVNILNENIENYPNLKLSSKHLVTLKRLEGFVPNAYLDSAGVWTVGYGFIKGVNKNTKITQSEANTRILKELKKYEEAVFHLTSKVNPTQNQFDALVLFTYNLGISSLKHSTLLKRFLSNDVNTSQEFQRWVFAGRPKRRIRGLVKRRRIEKNIFDGVV